jgi:hypothetical protein
MPTSFRLPGLVRVAFPLVAIALVVSPAFADKNKKDKNESNDNTPAPAPKPKKDKDDKKEKEEKKEEKKEDKKEEKKEEKKEDKKDKTEDNAQTCRASFRGFEANIDRSNCKTCTARTGIDTITRCKLELMTPLREKLCTVAFSGNNRPESFDVPFQYGKSSSTIQIGCPGKR